ncbi:MAG TPA: alpha-glucan family phosphorylase [Candidatus Sulfotelmatobacter sp.]|nr:alpha-glucan family phosphorylase [Candidatus Sulfotelmatobacter sp.]
MTTAENFASNPERVHALLVEDSAADAELIVHQLCQSGFDLSWTRVETEAEFLASLEKPPTIILADYSLPQFSGLRALELVQQRGLAIPFIMVSGAIGDEAAAAVVKQGATDYVLKSRLDRLGGAIMRALHGERKIAYFSMEIALESGIPTYSGGLGVLAGDTIRSAADLQLPVVAVSLLHRAGHFHQRFDAAGWQREEPVEWNVEHCLIEMPARAKLAIEGRHLSLRCWKYQMRGIGGYCVPVYLLDTDLVENSDWDRKLTSVLYGGDAHYRLCQEVVLGIGGVRMLRALGYERIDRFHMNEGHASLLTLELLQEEASKAQRRYISVGDLASVRQRCIFTTHTPVPAGHDQFALSSLGATLGLRENLSDLLDQNMALRVFGRHEPPGEMKSSPSGSIMLNMTYLGLNMSRYVNGVAKRHGEISRMMFAGYHIDAITNGVHAATWTSPHFQALYDRHVPDWRQDNFSLRHAESISTAEICAAHHQAKTALLALVNEQHHLAMNPEVFTIGFARRVTAYKRADLLFTDLDRLKKIAAQAGGLQLIYAGKAHPSDQEGKRLIRHILELKDALKDSISIAFLRNYDLALAKLITSGVDLWLNTPQPPLEASGTSGMKAALNGVPSLSIVDGWWMEGLIEGVTGWAIGDEKRQREDESSGLRDAASLYEKLESIIIPMFSGHRDRYIEVMRHAIAVNGSFFNTQRMLQQYVLNAYFR